jgi:(1->4)-alpha-D-glucan 1-alpha-D-glucosylmutase
VQTALKLTLPGMPDIYQGAELWDLNLVDPDNRRPVDYPARVELLCQVAASSKQNRRAAMLEMLEDWHNGRIKLAIVAALLACRRARPELFAWGGYEPLIATGPRADQICGFVRRYEEDMLVVIAMRFPLRCEENTDWTGTEIPWPRASAGRAHWRDVLCGGGFDVRDVAVGVKAVFGEMPVAVFTADGGSPA